jgi:hypothetical protein
MVQLKEFRAMGDTTPTPPVVQRIRNRDFMGRISAIKEIYSFLMKERIAVPSVKLGSIPMIRYSVFGRNPTREEWDESERILNALYMAVPPRSQNGLKATRVPRELPLIAICAVLVGLISLFVAIFRGGDYFTSDPIYLVSASNLNFICYCLWISSLGLAGATTYIIVNALSISRDATFDISFRKFVYFRLTLGVVLASVISFATLIDDYSEFIGMFLVYEGGQTPPQAITLHTELMMLTPFALGFFTTFGISVIKAVGGLLLKFGGTSRSD